MSLISIVVPVYNVEQYIKRCIDSLIHQTYKDIEILLVNDGSTDRSGIICEDYAQKDKRIKIIHKVNGGLTSARLAGFKVARGEYIAFVDSDDWVSRDMYKRLYNKIIEDAADICMCSYSTVVDNVKYAKSIPVKPGVYKTDQIREDILVKMAGRKNWVEEDYLTGFITLKLYKKTLIKEDWFFSEREFFAEDILFNLHAISTAKCVTVINENLYYYFYNSASLSNVYRNKKWDQLLKLNRYCRQFFQAQGLFDTAKLRLDNALIGAVLGSIDNEAKKNNTKSFFRKIEEISRIIKTPGVIDAVNMQLSDDNFKRRIYFILIRAKLSGLLLILSTLRMKRIGG
ncbi:glycosyltransferase involved in cell wall biosynthesis [Bacillus niacini]|uniref:Glycosyltransferase involved in cell wall biosynthesis n=1 Tax=Neobacillus niacini TaxID=86668 RepID=A0A852T6P0_9BACI|nr:glycosyltransferase [Neobacillus niacini]NYE03861.1 glycosyltransferase involved in cell wall biosynthesis [Neobacillus niacini]